MSIVIVACWRIVFSAESVYYKKIEWTQSIITTDYSTIIPEHSTPIDGLYLANKSPIYSKDRRPDFSVALAKTNPVFEELN